MKKTIYRIISFLIILSQLIICVPVLSASDYSGHWAEEQIQEWINSGRLTGDEHGRINPDMPITRAEFTALLMRSVGADTSVGTPELSDVTLSDWYFSAVATAWSLGVVTGDENGRFNPESSITREDAVVMTGRAYKTGGNGVFNITEYHDGMDISPYALEYMSYMCENGILTGYTDKTIRPLSGITRAEAVVLLDRIKTYFEDPTKNMEIKFADNYPRLNESGLSDGYNLSIKTNKPCKIYYMMVDSTRPSNIIDKSRINTYLIEVKEPYETVSAFIANDSKAEHTIYMKAVDEYGNESKVASIRKAKALYYSEGDGSEENPYIISTEEQLSAIRYYPDKHFKLKNNIALSAKWDPIGSGETQEEMFKGSLDGNGFKISGLSVNSDADYAGLFAYIHSGSVKNLYVSADRVIGKGNVGIIAGGVNGGRIENCATDGLVRTSGSSAGGIVGWNNGVISGCASAVLAIEAQTYAGGITGWNSGTVEECMTYNYSVMANMYSSAVAGVNSEGTVKNCVAANMNVTDYMTDNNGRITTNKSGGRTKNNYGYNKMYATVGDCLPDKDSQNGLDVTWEELNTKEFYTEVMGWDFDKSWKLAGADAMFRLPSLKNLPEPVIEEGLTIYVPERISSAEELYKLHSSADNHYMLTEDIILEPVEEGSNWTAVCADEETAENPISGFTGSFDGNGHTIYNMKMDYSEGNKYYGMFGVVAGGEVRNLNLANVEMSVSEITGAVAAVNYGSITNCSVSGVIRADQTESIAITGGVVGDNYGTVQNCRSNISITARGNSSSTGGITGNNESVVIGCRSKGRIETSGKSEASSASVGGIVGFSTDGMVYECRSDMEISAKAHIAYVGGICGMLNGGEIYMTEGNADIDAESRNALDASVYAGGIAGLSSNGIVMNSYSTGAVNAKGANVYAGGISGYNMLCHIQSCYSVSPVIQKGVQAVYAGGIAGINEEGFISDSVAINEMINNAGTVGRITGGTTGGMLVNNYASDEIRWTGRAFEDGDINGEEVDAVKLKDKRFFFRPVFEGGKLGWSTDGVWSTESGENPYYVYPVLCI